MKPTSNNERSSDPASTSDTPGEDYLARQIADARVALETTLDDLKLDLAEAADLRRWIRRYPWPAMGVALVAGFATAHLLTTKRRAKAEASQAGDEEVPQEPAKAAEAAKPQKKKQAKIETAGTGWRSTVISALFDILRVVVTQFIAASVRQAATSGKSPSNQPRHPTTTQATANPVANHSADGEDPLCQPRPPEPPSPVTD